MITSTCCGVSTTRNGVRLLRDPWGAPSDCRYCPPQTLCAFSGPPGSCCPVPSPRTTRTHVLHRSSQLWLQLPSYTATILCAWAPPENASGSSSVALCPDLIGTSLVDGWSRTYSDFKATRKPRPRYRKIARHSCDGLAFAMAASLPIFSNLEQAWAVSRERHLGRRRMRPAIATSSQAYQCSDIGHP